MRSFSEMEQKIREEVENPQEAQDLIDRVMEFLLNHYDHAPMKMKL